MQELRIRGQRVLLGLLVLMAVVSRPVFTFALQVSVTTWHNDNWRTGQNTNETQLTTSNVSQNTFGLICRLSVNGQIYAQPLVVADSSGGGMTVYVATMQDSLYAFHVPANLTSANCPTPLSPSPVNLLPGGEYPADCCFIALGKPLNQSTCSSKNYLSAIIPSVGVLGTPVVDTVTNTLYLVTESQYGDTDPEGQDCNTKAHPAAWYHRLHALDLNNGKSFLTEKFDGPIQIPPATKGRATFDSRKVIQRPGLLELPEPPVSPHSADSMVYLAFGVMDGIGPSGWIFGYKANDLKATNYPIYLAATPGPGAQGGGFWQGGAGLMAGHDSNGGTFLYFSTADGTFDLNQNQSPEDAGDSFVKLTPDLRTISGYFTPSDQIWRRCHDQDFGSGGVAGVPDGTLSHWPYLALKGDKEGGIWAIDRTSPGGYTGGAPNCQDDCSSQCLQPNPNLLQLLPTGGYYHTTPAYWNHNLYLAGAGIGNSAFPLTQYLLRNPGQCPNGENNKSPICLNTTYTGAHLGYSPQLSISSNGMGSGIVWAVEKADGNRPFGSKPGILHAFNANGLSELYTSDQCFQKHMQVDTMGPAVKFVVPTVANRYVFVGTETELDVFGALQRTCNPN
jgi:hypothetical protein